MKDPKKEISDRRDFRHLHDEDVEYVPGSKPKKHGSKDYILEAYCYKSFFYDKPGWYKRGSYKKMSDAEKAAESTRTKDTLYKGLALRIINKSGVVLKEYPEILELIRKFNGSFLSLPNEKEN